MSTAYESGTAVGKTHKLPCAKCDGSTVHEVVASYDAVEVDDVNDDRYWYYNHIVMCRGCEKVSFRHNWQSTGDTGWDADDGQHTLLDHEELYPARAKGMRKLAGAWRLPKIVSRIYDETHHAVTNGQRILSGIGIRALVEAVCKEKSVTGANLEKKIDEMVTRGLLTTEGAEILHGTRLLGNEAAHEIKPLDDDRLAAAMRVAEHLLETVYLIPAVAASLPRRLPKPATAQPGKPQQPPGSKTRAGVAGSKKAP